MAWNSSFHVPSPEEQETTGEGLWTGVLGSAHCFLKALQE